MPRRALGPRLAYPPQRRSTRVQRRRRRRVEVQALLKALTRALRVQMARPVAPGWRHQPEGTLLHSQPCGVLKGLLRLHGTNKGGQLGRRRVGAGGWAAHRRASMGLQAPAAHETLQLLEVLVPQRGGGCERGTNGARHRGLWLLLLLARLHRSAQPNAAGVRARVRARVSRRSLLTKEGTQRTKKALE